MMTSKALEAAAKALLVERAVRGGSRREDAQAVADGIDFKIINESLSDLLPDARAIIRGYAEKTTDEMAAAFFDCGNNGGGEKFALREAILKGLEP